MLKPGLTVLHGCDERARERPRERDAGDDSHALDAVTMTAGLNARCQWTMTVAMDRHTPQEPEIAAALQHAIALLEARSDHLRANASEIRARGGVPDLVEAAAEEAERHATTLRRLLGD